MNYYFDTPEKSLGDKAYTQRKYPTALKHYTKAKELLINMALEKNFNKDECYYDNLAFVLGELIITSAEILLDCCEIKLDNKEISKKWNLIPGLCKEMDSIYAQISHNTELNTDKERMNVVYNALANACKEVSHHFVLSIKKSASAEKITNALEWFSRTQRYRSKTGGTADIEQHFSYLELLANGFDYSQDLQFIKKIKTYVTENSLHQLSSLSAEQKLTVLYYQFLAATQNKDEEVHELKKQFEQFKRTSQKITSKHLISKFNQLIDNMSSEDSDDDFDILPNPEKAKKYNRIIEDDSEDEILDEVKEHQQETVVSRGGKAKKIKLSQATSTTEHQDVSTTKMIKKNLKAKKVVKRPTDLTADAAETLSQMSKMSDNDHELDNPRKRHQNTRAEEQMPSKFKKTQLTDKNKDDTEQNVFDGIEDPASENSFAVFPDNGPSLEEQPIQVSNRLLSHTPFTFFSTTHTQQASTSTAPVPLLQKHVAFKQVIVEIAKNYKSSEFLANLLSLIGDFYSKSCPSLLTLTNAQVMANSFYTTTLVLSTNHVVALCRLQKNSKAEGSSSTYASTAPQDIMSIFSQTIEDNITQIQEIPNLDPDQINKLFDELVHFIAKQINKLNLAGSKSQLLAELITTKYELILAKQVNTWHEEINPAQNFLNMK
ncbi:MAG: hypothetical protein LEGION0403_FIIPPAGN_01907 [Legionella sp.]|uniref:hypothetical protein n=1 Tax=Legionella sp. TaxID=459 RepID=UPI003D0AA040